MAKKYDGSARRRRGRPATPREIAELVVRMAEENPRWGYTRIRGALANLGHAVARSTVKRILLDHGIEPVEHYHGERNHQGLDNRLVERASAPVTPVAKIHRRERIGGLLDYYHREAT